MTRRLDLVSVQPDGYDHYENQDPGFRVALVHPYLVEAWQKNRLKYRESLALGYLTAALDRARFDVVSINAELLGLAPEDVVTRLLAEPGVGLVGISAKSQRTYRAAKQIAAALKVARPDLHITLGGVFPSAADVQVLEDCPDVDSIVRGEGEYAIVELAARVARHEPLGPMRGLSFRRGDGTVIRTAPRPRIRNLDELAFPARRDLEHLIDAGERGASSAYLVASRGCYAACTFCSIHQIYGDHNVVRRSPGSIADEMQAVIDAYGVNRFSFVDDLFIMPSKSGIQWVHDFCDVIADRRLDVNFYAEMRADTIEAPLVNRLVRAGMHRLFLGIESGVDSVLVRWDKGTTVADNDRALVELRSVGLRPHQINFGYIMFDPEMTFEELREQYRWIRNSGYAKVQHLQNRMNIYWGTPQYRKMIGQGRTDTAPLGGRWIYEFDDPRVGAFEGVVRRFHRRLESDPRTGVVLDARTAFLEHVHEDSTDLALPAWLSELLSQAVRRVDGAERDCYFSVFDALCVLLQDRKSIDVETEEELWRRQEPLLDQVAADARLLHTLVASLERIEVTQGRPEGAIPRPDTAELDEHGREDQRVAIVWLPGADRPVGLRCVLGDVGNDRYDHRCDVVDVTIDGAGRLSLRRRPQVRLADLSPVPTGVAIAPAGSAG